MEGSVAHPERDGAMNEVGKATEARFDGHSDRGGANFDDGDVPAAAVEEMVNQPGTKHHDIEAKLKQELEIAEAHRNALATATRTPRWCCRPRGRRAASDVPR